MEASESRSKESLREFQTRLAEKLKAAEAASGASSKLGFIAGGRHWLVGLDQVNEVVTVPGLTEVPWVQPWFSGVASVRGALYGCVDLAAFLGLSEPLPPGEVRLLLAHPRFGINAALRVERALGLRPISDLAAEAAPAEATEWEEAHWRDAEGQVWTEISMERLVTLPAYLEAGL
ncbi:MAG TPA: chemotaxis protein CheW [Thiobacillaceae bacterium]|nr:chemotaxis protein CheW [Thiobacillaceae bacterium]HNA81469.1 chemotaxis protein CheW [Thiobacillaceae bacterium]HNF88462.1 chemotaxis protein CheW [Thiobacillaceae bacterium]HNH87990.1 chemotaxis protein CheW [Thiobacillaceae bacterium]HNI06719.1 chemotaxis protein CheW [Thiobacillaceae bacterium]